MLWIRFLVELRRSEYVDTSFSMHIHLINTTVDRWLAHASCSANAAPREIGLVEREGRHGLGDKNKPKALRPPLPTGTFPNQCFYRLPPPPLPPLSRPSPAYNVGCASSYWSTQWKRG